MAMTEYPDAIAPLGPIKTKTIWRYEHETATSGEGYFPWGEYYVDQYGNEYNSVSHVLRCAVAKSILP